MTQPLQVTCPRCTNVYPDIYRECPKCQSTAPEQPRAQRIPNKYPVVSIIATIIRAISVIAFVIGIALIPGNANDKMIGYSLAPTAVALFLSASFIIILIDIEKNTRKQ